MSLSDRVKEACRSLAEAAPFEARTAIILGSGLGSVREAFQAVRAVPYREIPHFPVSTVRGHRGEMVFARHDRHNVVILDGRVHCYEGYSWDQVTLPARVLAGLGVTTIIVTNASGSVSGRFRPGDVLLIDDHIDLMWRGLPDFEGMWGREGHAIRRPYYSRRLADLAEQVALREGVTIKRGVLLGSSGPAYETRTEVEFARKSGADAVTMSTVPEVTVCHQLGVSVVGLSLITNVAAAHEGGHEKVIDFAATASKKLGTVIVGLVDAISTAGW